MLLNKDYVILKQESIPSGWLADLYGYWLDNCVVEGDKISLPHMSNIDPVEMPRGCLPNVTLIDVLHKPFDLVVRLAGTNIVKYHEAEQRGKRLMDITTDPFISNVYDWYKNSALTKSSTAGSVSFVTDAGLKLNVERVALPYVDDDGDVARLLSGINFIK